MNNWNKFKRVQINIDKAQENKTLADQLTKHYEYLHKKLVETDNDEETFNDTDLKLTRKYNPNLDFIEQFTHQFYNLKIAYTKDLVVDKYNTVYLEDKYNEVEDITENDLAVITAKNAVTLNDIINDIDAFLKETK